MSTKEGKDGETVKKPKVKVKTKNGSSIPPSKKKGSAIGSGIKKKKVPKIKGIEDPSGPEQSTHKIQKPVTSPPVPSQEKKNVPQLTKKRSDIELQRLREARDRLLNTDFTKSNPSLSSSSKGLPVKSTNRSYSCTPTAPPKRYSSLRPNRAPVRAAPKPGENQSSPIIPKPLSNSLSQNNSYTKTENLTASAENVPIRIGPPGGGLTAKNMELLLAAASKQNETKTPETKTRKKSKIVGSPVKKKKSTIVTESKKRNVNLIERFRMIPVEEISKIYEECGKDYFKTVSEVVLLVALVEAEQRNESLELLRKWRAEDKANSGEAPKVMNKQEEEELVESYLMRSLELKVKRPAKTSSKTTSEGKITLRRVLGTRKISKKKKKVVIDVVSKQFPELAMKEIEFILSRYDYVFDSEGKGNGALQDLLLLSENQKIAELQISFHSKFSDGALRVALAEADWNVAAAAVELSRRLMLEKGIGKEEERKEDQKNVVELKRLDTCSNLRKLLEEKVAETGDDQDDEKDDEHKEHEEKKTNHRTVSVRAGLAKELEEILTKRRLNNGSSSTTVERSPAEKDEQSLFMDKFNEIRRLRANSVTTK